MIGASQFGPMTWEIGEGCPRCLFTPPCLPESHTTSCTWLMFKQGLPRHLVSQSKSTGLCSPGGPSPISACQTSVPSSASPCGAGTSLAGERCLSMELWVPLGTSSDHQLWVSVPRATWAWGLRTCCCVLGLRAGRNFPWTAPLQPSLMCYL